MNFKSWEDFHRFLKKYATCSCLNCTGYLGSTENCEMFICMETLSPVRLNMLQLCAEWKDKDGKTLDDFGDEYKWKFSSEVAEKLDKMQNVTFEEAEEVIKNECERTD